MEAVFQITASLIREKDISTVTESMEVFGLGSTIYSVATGHRPHGPSVFKTTDEIIAYGKEFERLIRSGILPDATNIKGGNIIRDCWTKKIPSAKMPGYALWPLRQDVRLISKIGK